MICFGNRIEMMVDRFLLQDTDNVRFCKTEPTPLGKALGFDRPWEGLGSLGLTVFDDAPILPELFAGSLLYRYSDRENYELLEHLRLLADTVEQDVEYAAYASAYSPELMSLRIDIRTPEEIAEDEAMLSFDSDSDEDEEFDLDFDDDDDADDEDEDEDGEMSDEDMEAFLGELGLTLDDLFGKIDGIVGSDSDDDEQ